MAHRVAVTDKSLLEGRDAPWSPMAWRSFKMSPTAPSSLGAEAPAMSVALGFVEWATLFLQELIHGQFDLQGAPAVMQETSRMRYRLQELVRSFVNCGTPVDTVRQTVSHQCADHSRVHEEDRLCDALSTHRTTLGRRSHERTGRACRMSKDKGEVWIVYAPV